MRYVYGGDTLLLPPPSRLLLARKSSLCCTRHAVLPDNEFEAAKGLHVEDIDCKLVVRPTRTALDLTFFGEVRLRLRLRLRLETEDETLCFF